MGVVKQIHIKNRTYYFYDVIDLKKIDDCERIYIVNPLYLHIDHANGYILLT